MSSNLEFGLLEQVNVKSVVTVQVEQDILLKNFENILEFLKQLGQGHIKLNQDIQDFKDENEKMKNLLDMQTNEMGEHRKSHASLNDRQDTQGKDVAQTKDDVHNYKDQINKNSSDIASILDQLRNLQGGTSIFKPNLVNSHQKSESKPTMQNPSNNSNNQNQNNLQNQGSIQNNSVNGVDSNEIQALQNQIESLKSQFVTKPEFQDRCKQEDNEFSDIWEQINALKQKIGARDFGQEINVLQDELGRKANTSTLNQEINFLKNLIAQLGNSDENQKEALIQEMQENQNQQAVANDMQPQIDDLLSLIQALQNQVNGLVDNYNLLLESHIDLDHDPAQFSNLNSPIKQRPSLSKQGLNNLSQQNLQLNNKAQQGQQTNQGGLQGNSRGSSRNQSSNDKNNSIQKQNSSQISNNQNQAQNNFNQFAVQDQPNLKNQQQQNVSVNYKNSNTQGGLTQFQDQQNSNETKVSQHSRNQSYGSRPQSKLSHLKDVIQINTNTNQSSKRNSKLKVDQNRELIEMLRKDLQRLSGELELQKKKSSQSAQGVLQKQSTFGNQNNNQISFDNTKNEENLQQLLEQNQSQSDLIGNLDQRLSDLEEKLKNYALNEEVDQLRNEVGNMTDNLNETQAQSKENAINIKEIRKQLEHQHKLSSQGNANDTTLNLTINEHNNNQGGGNIQVSSGQDNDDFNAKLKGLKDYLISLMKALKDDINKKPSFEDLQKSEAYNLEKLDEVAGALINKLADKGETKKALQHLEKKINQIYLILAREGGGGQGTEEDALIVKRPLLWSCISCDKNLDKYNGKLGEYKAWKIFPPKETSPERIGKFGRGWKQQIEKKQKINTERMDTEYSNGSQDGNTQLPKINRNRGNTYDDQVQDEQ